MFHPSLDFDDSSEKDLTEKIIEEVKKHPCLYDVEHKKYKNYDHRVRVWEALVPIVGFEGTGIELAARWRNIRDSFTSAKRRLMKKASRNALEDPPITWQYYEQMLWVEDYLQDRPAKQSQSRNNVPTRSLVKRRNDQTEEVFSAVSVLNESLAKTSKTTVEKVQIETETAEQAFGKHIALELTGLTQYQRDLAMLKISQVIFDCKHHTPPTQIQQKLLIPKIHFEDEREIE